MKKLLTFFTTRNPFLFLIIIYFLDLFNFVEASNIDFIIFLFIGFIYTIILNIRTELIANQTMNLILYKSLVNKGILEDFDVFSTQNSLIGDTNEVDGNKFIKMFRDSGIFLHEYLNEEDMLKYKKLFKSDSISMFSSFRNLVDRTKISFIKDYIKNKINKIN